MNPEEDFKTYLSEHKRKDINTEDVYTMIVHWLLTTNYVSKTPELTLETMMSCEESPDDRIINFVDHIVPDFKYKRNVASMIRDAIEDDYDLYLFFDTADQDKSIRELEKRNMRLFLTYSKRDVNSLANFRSNPNFDKNLMSLIADSYYKGNINVIFCDKVEYKDTFVNSNKSYELILPEEFKNILQEEKYNKFISGIKCNNDQFRVLVILNKIIIRLFSIFNLSGEFLYGNMIYPKNKIYESGDDNFKKYEYEIVSKLYKHFL